MRRGELAYYSGCNIETVRFYEKRGLLPAPPRTAGGQRDYDREHLKRLIFICRSRELGFTLDQVRSLLGLAGNPGDWALHCHKSHHTMNTMGHEIPNLIGVDQRGARTGSTRCCPATWPWATVAWQTCR